jgi:hypothetical protein
MTTASEEVPAEEGPGSADLRRRHGSAGSWELPGVPYASDHHGGAAGGGTLGAGPILDHCWCDGTQSVLQVAAVGPPGSADAASLRRELDGAGLADMSTRLSLVDGGSQELPAAEAG